MARMTATDMVALVRRAVGSSPTDRLPDNDILRFINLIKEDIENEFNLPATSGSFNYTTVSGTQRMNLGTEGITDCRRLVSGIITSTGQRVLEINSEKFDRLNGASTTNTGDPTSFLASSTTLFDLTPIPTRAVVISWSYEKKNPALVLNPAGTSLVIDEVWDNIVLDFAIIRCFMQLEKFSEAQKYAVLTDVGTRKKNAWERSRSKVARRSKTQSRLTQVCRG